MHLNRESWHARLFFWALGVWNEFRNNESQEVFFRQQTNLCHYIRVLLVWMPLVLGIHAVLIGSTVWAFIILPIYLFGITGYGWTIAVIVGLIVAVFALVYFLKLLGRLFNKAEEWRDRPAVEKPDTGPSFWEVLRVWKKAQKDKMCPFVDFAVPTVPKTEEASNA